MCVVCCTHEALPGVLGIQGEGKFIFRDLGRREIYFQGFGEKGHLFSGIWGAYFWVFLGSRGLRKIILGSWGERSFSFQGAKTPGGGGGGGGAHSSEIPTLFTTGSVPTVIASNAEYRGPEFKPQWDQGCCVVSLSKPYLLSKVMINTQEVVAPPQHD